MSEECRNCGRDAGDAFACRMCAETAAADLASVADFARHLDDKRARLGSNWQNGTIGRAAEIPLPYDPRVSKVADPIRVALHGSARIVWEGSGADFTGDPRSITAVALWLARHCDWLRRQEVGPDEFTEFTAHRVALEELFDNPPETFYMGLCGTELEDGSLCAQSLYIQRELTGLLCPTCMTLHRVEERREELQAAVADYLGTAKEISALCRNQFGDDVSTAMIRGYLRYGLLQSKGTRTERTRTGDRQSSLFRIGDVRELIGVLSRDEKRRRALRRAVVKESVA